MDQALDKALKRRLELEKELRRLNEFIHMYHELTGTDPDEVRQENLARVMIGSPVSKADLDRMAASHASRLRGRPADFAQIMQDVLKEAGRPLQRGDLVEEVEKRGHSIPSTDKPRYLGTILWRHQDVFESHEGKGYWLKNVPLPDEPELLGGDGWTHGSSVDLK
ncbi:hypothetical protein [Bradyrhizobium sp. DASA03120]|uniref:hypothetical protein n=1 Tax=Bradyrhizobium sp. SMVTL-02 TaxID=3395917 RepID=UPI003F71BF98